MSDAAAAGARAAFVELELAQLRRRRSLKWQMHPGDVLPAFVAEMDFALAPPVAAALAAAVANSDTGYAWPASLPEAFAGFAARRFDWQVDPERVRVAPDVMTGVAELLRALTAPGDGVVVTPPVYGPYFRVTVECGRRVVEAPLQDGLHGTSLDLEAIAAAFRAGARTLLLCQPHNPTGRSYRRDELAPLAELAAAHGAVVISDEVHAPLTLEGRRHVPYAAVAEPVGGDAVTVVSASKAWNLAGLKCALIVSGSEQVEGRLREGMPDLLPRIGHLGVIASLAAFAEGEEWLDALVDQLAENHRLLAGLLAERLPAVAYIPPEAGYLAWLDCRRLGLGDDPAAVFLERGRVALSSGPGFGAQGAGFARLNVGTSPGLLEQAVERMALALA